MTWVPYKAVCQLYAEQRDDEGNVIGEAQPGAITLYNHQLDGTLGDRIRAQWPEVEEALGS